MELCLYHPTLGYYNKGSDRVGRNGDFYTSVSVGACFGTLLAHRIANHIHEQLAHETFDLVEIGANTGQLACDILDELRDYSPTVYARVRYTICEPLSSMRAVQLETLLQHPEKIQHLNTLRDITSPLEHAVILSNELIDAFPVKLIKKIDGDWLELKVTSKDSNFEFIPSATFSPSLLEFTNTLPTALPDGYTTEYRPGLNAFADSCSQALKKGLIITIDYGHIHRDFYQHERITGTLRTFHQHTAGEIPLEHIGEQDITAHVDFTQLATALQAVDLEPSYFNSQTRYLTHHAADLFKRIETQSDNLPTKLIRQFQTLTHPAMMGRQFHVLECVKNGSKHPEVRSRLDLT